MVTILPHYKPQYVHNDDAPQDRRLIISHETALEAVPRQEAVSQHNQLEYLDTWEWNRILRIYSRFYCQPHYVNVIVR